MKIPLKQLVISKPIIGYPSRPPRIHILSVNKRTLCGAETRKTYPKNKGLYFNKAAASCVEEYPLCKVCERSVGTKIEIIY